MAVSYSSVEWPLLCFTVPHWHWIGVGLKVSTKFCVNVYNIRICAFSLLNEIAHLCSAKFRWYLYPLCRVHPLREMQGGHQSTKLAQLVPPLERQMHQKIIIWSGKKNIRFLRTSDPELLLTSSPRSQHRSKNVGIQDVPELQPRCNLSKEIYSMFRIKIVEWSMEMEWV